MAVYFITGKLGAGKTLSAVGRIRDALQKGVPVATNLDLRLDKLIGVQSKKCRVYRMPDKPTLADFEAIGKGNTSYDESQNGLIVLDECGTWFNSRSWADRERQSVINWLLHARKLGWDILFLIQDISIVDKQARLALAEHVVYCRRFDKFGMPILGSLWKLFTGSVLRFPKLHLGIVKYGDQQHSLTVDRWWYLGHDLYDAYDTKQAFSDFYPHTTYQVLPPWYSHGRYRKPLTWSRAMRLTRVYWRRWSRPVVAGAFFALGVAAAIYFREAPPPAVVQPAQAAEAKAAEQGAQSEGVAVTEPSAQASASVTTSTPVRDQYQAWVIAGYMKLGARTVYQLRGPDGAVQTLDALAARGIDVFPLDACRVRLVSAESVEDFVTLYAPACQPEKPNRPALAEHEIPAEPLAQYVPKRWDFVSR